MKRTIFVLLIMAVGILIPCSYSLAQVECESAEECYEKGIDNNNPDTQMQYYTKAIEFDESGDCGTGEIGAAYKKRGSIYFFNTDLENAFMDYNKVIELNPTDGDAYLHRGVIYDITGQPDNAFNDYNKAIELIPDSSHAYKSRGDAYYSKGDYDSAIKDYTNAIELLPDFAYAYIDRGYAYERKGDYEKALKDYKKGLELNPATNIRDQVLTRIEELKKKTGD